MSADGGSGGFRVEMEGAYDAGAGRPRRVTCKMLLDELSGARRDVCQHAASVGCTVF